MPTGTSDDAAIRRANFVKVMRNRFVNGKDIDFNYALVDDDSELDDVVELGRDAEEKYFDEQTYLQANLAWTHRHGYIII